MVKCVIAKELHLHLLFEIIVTIIYDALKTVMLFVAQPVSIIKFKLNYQIKKPKQPNYRMLLLMMTASIVCAK